MERLDDLLNHLEDEGIVVDGLRDMQVRLQTIADNLNGAVIKPGSWQSELKIAFNQLSVILAKEEIEDE